MKIILKYILNNIKERKTRTAVMLLSIVLSTTLLFVSLATGASYESAQRKMAKGMAGSAAVSVSAVPGETGSEAWIREDAVPHLPSIKNMVCITKASALYHEDGYYETFDILAADLEQLNQINKPRLTDGSELTDFTGYQIVLPDRFTSKYGVRVGDSITLKIRGNEVKFQVAAIAAYDTVFLRSTRGFNALLPKETLAEILGAENGCSEILIEPGDNVEPEALKEELENVLSPVKCNVSVIVNEEQVSSDARQKSMPFLLISFFSLTMSVFIIYSSYKVITMERLPIIGTFRSIGAAEKTVVDILMLESLMYGVAGGISGIPLGFAVLKLILQGWGNSLVQGIEIPMVILPSNIILPCTAAVIVSLLSAYIPVRRASRLPVKDVVLGTVEERSVPHMVKLAAGAVLMITAIILPYFARGKMLYTAGGFSLLGLIAAAIIVAPIITSFVSALLEHIYGSIFGNEGRLAARNIRGNKNVNQNITLLFISISAVIAINVIGSFVNTYIADVFRGAELDGFADAMITTEFVERVKKLEGIEKVLPVYELNNRVQGNGITLGQLEAADDLKLYNSMFALNYDNDIAENEAVSAFGVTRTALLSEDSLKKYNVMVGDMISLTSRGKAYDYKIVGSFKSRANSVEAIIPAIYARADFGALDYGFLAYTAADPEAIMVQIRDLLGNTPNWSRTVEEFNSDALRTVGAFLEPMYKMTYFILLLAMIGIINNLLINYIQKRRSIAMYKSVGLSNRQNVKMTLIEGFTVGLIGAAIAVGISYLELNTIIIVAGPKILIKPELDLGVFLTAGAAGIIVTLIGSIVPIIKGMHMKVMEEIKS